MSLFTRTVAQVDQLDASFQEFDTATKDPIPTRKQAADAVNALVTELSPTIAKLVTKAEAGERDPNKRIYGAGMVTKIFALNDRFKKICTDFTPRYETLLDDWKAHENEQRIEAERKRAEEEEKSRAYELRQNAERLEQEKRQLAERERLQKEQEEKLRLEAEAAAKKAEDLKLEVERQKREAERLAEEEKRKEEEKKAADHKKRELELAAKAAEASSKSSPGEAGQSASISVTIKTTRGVTHILKDVPATATVGDLKARIESEHKIRKDAQRLIFQGRLLVDAKSITSYKIANGSAVHLVETAKSGASAASSTTPPVKWLVPPSTLCHLQNGKQQFDEIVAQCGSKRLVVVDWFAPWCGPCRAIAPAYERLATRFSDVTFVKVDTEASPANAELAAQNEISAYPTFTFHLNNQVKHSFSGANASEIEANIRKYREMAVAQADGNTSGASSSAGQSSRSPITTRLLSALTTLKRNVPLSDFIVAVRTLLTFVGNIVSNPGMEKYRRVRTANSTFQSRLGSKQGGIECMRAFGFTDAVDGNDTFLVMSAEIAEDPMLRTVMSQLEAAIGGSTGSASAAAPRGTPAAAPRGTPVAPTAGDAAGAMPRTNDMQNMLAGGLAGMFGGGNGAGQAGGGGGMPNAMVLEMMQDPAFQQFAAEMVADPAAMSTIMEAQRAFASGDMATLQRLQAHPSMARLVQAMTSNPVFLRTMMQEMAQRGPTGAWPGAGVGGGAATGARTDQGTGGTQGGGGTGTAGGTPAGMAAPPQFPGAPSTAEEEERLLQEAIRLSMQDQQKPPEDNRESDGDSKDKQT